METFRDHEILSDEKVLTKIMSVVVAIVLKLLKRWKSQQAEENSSTTAVYLEAFKKKHFFLRMLETISIFSHS